MRFAYGAAGRDSLSQHGRRVTRGWGWPSLTWPGLGQQQAGATPAPGLPCQHDPTGLCHFFFHKAPIERERAQILRHRLGCGSHSWPCRSRLQPQTTSRSPSLLHTFFFSELLNFSAADLLCRKLCILPVLLCQL